MIIEINRKNCEERGFAHRSPKLRDVVEIGLASDEWDGEGHRPYPTKAHKAIAGIFDALAESGVLSKEKIESILSDSKLIDSGGEIPEYVVSVEKEGC